MKHLIVLLHMYLLLTFSIPIYANTIVTDGLINYWTFDLTNIKDGIAEDVWGGNDATIKGNPKISDGYLRQGLELDGLGDYVILEQIRNFSRLRGTFTFEIWIKTDNHKNWSPIFKVIEQECSLFGDGTGIIINARLNVDQKEENDRFIFKKDYVTLEEIRKTVNGGCTGGTSAYPINISDGNWHQFVYVVATPSNNEVGPEWRRSSLYIDSIRKSERKAGGSRHDIYTGAIYLGAVNRMGKAKNFFRGVIDEVRVYDRELSQEEINQNFNAKTSLTVDSTRKLPTVWGTLKHR